MSPDAAAWLSVQDPRTLKPFVSCPPLSELDFIISQSELLLALPRTACPFLCDKNGFQGFYDSHPF